MNNLKDKQIASGRATAEKLGPEGRTARAKAGAAAKWAAADAIAEHGRVVIDKIAYRRVRPEHAAGLKLFRFEANRMTEIGTCVRCVTAAKLQTAANTMPKILLEDGRTVRLPKRGAWRLDS